MSYKKGATEDTVQIRFLHKGAKEFNWSFSLMVKTAQYNNSERRSENIHLHDGFRGTTPSQAHEAVLTYCNKFRVRILYANTVSRACDVVVPLSTPQVSQHEISQVFLYVQIAFACESCFSQAARTFYKTA